MIAGIRTHARLSDEREAKTWVVDMKHFFLQQAQEVSTCVLVVAPMKYADSHSHINAVDMKISPSIYARKICKNS